MLDLTPEIQLQSTRSGGKGGQNVNKVETAVLASFDIPASALLNEEQKALLAERLSNRINSEGRLWVKAQVHRTQLENRAAAIRRLHELVAGALQKKKARIATRPSKAAREERIESKKRQSERKQGRQRYRPE